MTVIFNLDNVSYVPLKFLKTNFIISIFFPLDCVSDALSISECMD